MMKALLIDPANQSIEETDIAGTQDIPGLIGFDTIDSDAVGNEGDRLYFDEECFLRQSEGRFKIGSLIPVAGRGVIVGTDGDEGTLCDAAIDVDELRARIRYL